MVMSIVGGAMMPPILGLVADATGILHVGYVIPFLCFVVISWFFYTELHIENEKHETELKEVHQL